MMGWSNDGWGGGSWLTMSVMMLLWIALIGIAIWAAVHLLRGNGASRAGVSTAPTPRAILDHRLASGEIDAEQYAQLRRLLDGSSTGTVSSEGPARP